MDETKTIYHLGPYDVNEVDDDILGGLVYNQEVPIIIKQKTGDGTTVFAVLAKDKGIKIACAGCFHREMKISDSTRCKKCSSFVKHFDTKDGVRRTECKETGSDIKDIAENCRKVKMDFDGEISTKVRNSKTVTDQDILDEVKKRNLAKVITEHMDDESLNSVMMARGIFPIVGARTTRLIHELRRQAENVGVGAYYRDKKKRDLAHCDDAVGASLVVTSRQTRQKKEEVATIKVFKPKSITDYT